MPQGADYNRRDDAALALAQQRTRTAKDSMWQGSGHSPVIRALITEMAGRQPPTGLVIYDTLSGLIHPPPRL